MTAVMPAPNNQALVVQIECTSHPINRIGETHEIVIHPDWSVSTMHDLESERVSRSLGAWSSCLHFAESIVPGYRQVLQVMREPTSLTHRDGGWYSTSPPFCPGGHRFATVREAVRHEINGVHVARMFESSEWRFDSDSLERAGYQQFRELLWVARREWADVAEQGVVRLDVDGYMQMWRDGLLPEHAEALATLVPRMALPMPVEHIVDSYWNAVKKANSRRPE